MCAGPRRRRPGRPGFAVMGGTGRMSERQMMLQVWMRNWQKMSGQENEIV